MKRVLKPGGLLIISVPGYVQDPERDLGRATHTYRVHYRFDYYRFSEQAVREVFFEGMRAREGEGRSCSRRGSSATGTSRGQRAPTLRAPAAAPEGRRRDPRRADR